MSAKNSRLQRRLAASVQDVAAAGGGAGLNNDSDIDSGSTIARHQSPVAQRRLGGRGRDELGGGARWYMRSDTLQAVAWRRRGGEC